MPALQIDSSKLCKFVERQFNFQENMHPERMGWNFNAFSCIQRSSDATPIDFTSVLDKEGKCIDKRVQVEYRLPDCNTEADECLDDFLTCGPVATEKPACEYDLPQVKGCAQESFSMSMDAYRCDCKDPDADFLALMKQKVHNIAKKKFKYLLEQLALGAGSSYYGSTATSGAPLPLKILDDSGKPQAQSLFAMRSEYLKQSNGSLDKVFAITGSEKLASFDYMQNLDYGECGGQVKTNDRFMEVCFDHKVQEILTDIGSPAGEPIITFAPGAFKIIELHEFDNRLLTQRPNERSRFLPVFNEGRVLKIKQDVGTPFLGFPLFVDMIVEKEYCENAITVKMQACYDLWKIPQEAWCGTYNWCLLWDAVCQDTICDDFCSQYVPA